MTNAEKIYKYTDNDLRAIFDGLCYLTSQEDCNKINDCEKCKINSIIKWLREYDYTDGKPTNADRIRSMSNEELAATLFDERYCPPNRLYFDCNHESDCNRCRLEWLKENYKK